jgi:hypothetical protein
MMDKASAGVAEAGVEDVGRGGRKAGFEHLQHIDRSREPTKALVCPACSSIVSDRQSVLRIVLHPSMSDIWQSEE